MRKRRYERGALERDAGRYAAAAAEFDLAYSQIPPAEDKRATVLLELVDARRRAFAAGGRTRGREHPAAHLCAAAATLTEFIDTSSTATRVATMARCNSSAPRGPPSTRRSSQRSSIHAFCSGFR